MGFLYVATAWVLQSGDARTGRVWLMRTDLQQTPNLKLQILCFVHCVLAMKPRLCLLPVHINNLLVEARVIMSCVVIQFKERARRWGLLRMVYGLGLITLLIGHLPVFARVVPVYYSDNQGMEEGAQALMSRTVNVLNEQLPGLEFRVTRLNSTRGNAQNEAETPGLYFGDAAQTVRLEAVQSLRPVATVERHFEGQSTYQGGGVVLARAGSGFSTFADLPGQVVGGVEGAPLLSWVAVNRQAQDVGLDLLVAPSDLLMRSNDQAVVRAVLAGDADVGIVASGVLEGMVAAGDLAMTDVAILTPREQDSPVIEGFPFAVSTALYPEYRLMAFESLPNEVVRSVGAVLLSLDANALFPDDPMKLAWTLPISCAAVQTVLKELGLPPFEQNDQRNFVVTLRRYFFAFLGVGALIVVLGVTVSYVWALNRSLQSEIDERAAAEKVMKQSVERFQDIVSCSGDWIWEANAQEQFTYCSDAVEKLLGWKPAALMGESMMDVLSSAERCELEDERLLQPDKDLRRTLRMLTADGRVVVHECVAVAIRGATGRVLGYRGVNRDVTQKQRVVSFDDE